ncbi:MAG: hypothetical protein IT432_10845 [Phycisphaerales bacterium]|nr:hypothetical protein [Phycisphaerales bacterium]
MTRFERWCAALLSLTLCVMAMARLRQESVDLLGSLPNSVHVAIIIDDASALRRSPAGRALETWLHSAGLLSETSEAWGRLAATIDLPQERVFDAMLGESVLIAMEFVPDPGRPGGVDAHWAVMTRIEPGFEKRLYERLKPAPRGVSGGRPVLSLENGRFELATTDSADARNQAGDRRATAILAPASSTDLFDKLVSGQAGVGQRLADVSGFGLAEVLGTHPVIAVLRGPLPGEYASPESLKEPSSILALGLRGTADDRWEATIAGNPALMTASRPPGGVAALTLPRAAIRQIAADAMFVFAGPTDGMNFSNLPGPLAEQLTKLTGETRELDALLGPRMLMWMHPADSTSGFAMSVGVQMSDVVRGSELGDATLTRVLRDHACPTGPDGARLSKELTFEGLSPEAQRSVEFRAADQVVREGQERAFMAWSYEESGPGAEGWWIASLARGGSIRAVSAEIERLRAVADVPAEAERDVFSVVRLRPAAFMKLAGPAASAIPIARAMAQIESVGWEVFLTETGTARGTAWLEFAKPSTTPVAAPPAGPDPAPADDPEPTPR